MSLDTVNILGKSLWKVARRNHSQMAVRSVLSRRSLSLTRSMESSRGAFTRLFSDKGRVLSEEEQAKENVYIQKWERERLEKQKQKAEKEKTEKAKGDADKKPEGTHQG